jgi:Fe(3+) dicitrate transport protein
VFSGGLQLYTTDSQRTDTRGATAFADSTPVRTSQRVVLYVPVFAENLFRFGKLSITPGVRVETFRQSVAVNPNATAPDREQSDAVPLFGLGAAYDLPSKTQVYANLSESYRPILFSEAVPTSGGTTVAGDLAEGRAWQAEVGYRGEPAAGFVFDTSVFHMVFDDKIGTVGGVTGNIGRADYSGAEAAVQYDLLRQLEGARGLHQLNLLGNLTVLDAEIPSTGKTPMYAPDYLVRTGLIYSQTRRAKIAFLGTYVADSFADDDNTAQRAVPAYLVWDLTGEYTLAGTPFTLLAGVNNVFDEAYTSRIRGDGIDPAAGRNFYLGFRAEF